VNPAICQQALDGVGSGVAASLRAVDCAASATAEAAFGRLFGSGAGGGSLLPVLTILLTLYVAFFAFSLITGRSRLGVSALTPRMITLGLVLTFATSWMAYQSVVWNLAIGAPDQIAGLLLGTSANGASATQIFADKIDVILGALVDASGQQGTNAAAATSTFSPAGLMWLGGTLLLLGTVGILATCKIALAVLLVLGPIFVVMALFAPTRGLFSGWLKGVVLLAVTPLFAVLGGSLMLELSVPVVRGLTAGPALAAGGEVDARAAMAFFMIGAVHVALMVMVLKVAGTMVGGWRVFGLAGSGAESSGAGRSAPLAGAAGAAGAVTVSSAGAAATPVPAPSRQIRMAPTSVPVAANDSAGSAPTARRETRVVTTSAVPAAAGPVAPSRARGIGSRFRAPQASSLEKIR
jgi:type IV secretion system protein VirB6